MPVRASSSHALLIANWQDGNRPKPVVLPVRIRSSTRAWQRRRTSRTSRGRRYRDPDAELCVQSVFAQASDVGEELVAAARRIRPDKDRAAVSVRLEDFVAEPCLET
jgi:hypothetical protein